MNGRFPQVYSKELLVTEKSVRSVTAIRAWATVFTLFCLAAFSTQNTAGQVTTGSVSGIVRDTSGAVVPETEVTLTELRTGRRRQAGTDEQGFYSFRFLPPGRYRISLDEPGFGPLQTTFLISAGRDSSVSLHLSPGGPSQVIEVQAQPFKPDAVHHSLSSILTDEEIDELPMNGRNFLDAAQLLPGVTLIDATELLDPVGAHLSKRQFTGLSIGGRTGRTTRITVDGLDISDEFVGTTLQNLSPDSIQELQVTYASMDPSISLTSQGAVNIVTRSGGSEYHGSAFFLSRDSRFAALPVSRTGDPSTNQRLEDAKFDRQHLGFRLGGPILEDRLYFFLNYENVNQDGSEFIRSEAFPQWNGPVRIPFDADMAMGRLDWDVSTTARAFFRMTYDDNRGVSGVGGSGMAPQWNTNMSSVLAGGLDWSHATTSHSIRVGYGNFNADVSGRTLTALPVVTDSTEMAVSLLEGTQLATAPSETSPQQSYQTNNQFKYDGLWALGRHLLRFGGEINYIRSNFRWAFYGEGPVIRFTYTESERQQILSRGGDPLDPLEYPLSSVTMGNGRGYFSEIPNQGRPLGGINNTRLAGYVADHIRWTRSLNLNLGLRYELDTGQVNDDLGLPEFLADVLGPEGIRPTRLDTNNFAPQLGFAWQPFGDGRTVLRAGAGVFYETQLLVNTAMDRQLRLPPGLNNRSVTVPNPILYPDGRVTVFGEPVNSIDTRTWGGATIGSVLDEVGQTFRDFQQATQDSGYDPRGEPLIWYLEGTGDSLLFPHDYSTPYSIQTNIGIEHQFGPNWLIGVDFLHNRNHHAILQSLNNFYAADTLNIAAAREWLDGLASFGGFEDVEAFLQQMLADGTPFWRLRMGNFFVGDHPLDVDYPETNINLWTNAGLSTYKGLQVRARGRLASAGCCIRGLDLDLSYAFSRYSGSVGDQDSAYGRYPEDNRVVAAEPSGPAGFDRTHQLNVFLRTELPGGFILNMNHRMRSSLPTSLRLGASSFGADTLFYSDLNGDGAAFDLLPGTRKGSFGRDVKSAGSLNELIGEFNRHYAGSLSPAAAALVEAGLFSEEQLRAFGVVIPPLDLAPDDQVMNDSFITTDVRFGKQFRVGESVSIEPAVEMFNVFNVANCGSLRERMLGRAGDPNGTSPGERTDRIGQGSGSFGQGMPRSLQFAVRIRF